MAAHTVSPVLSTPTTLLDTLSRLFAPVHRALRLGFSLLFLALPQLLFLYLHFAHAVLLMCLRSLLAGVLALLPSSLPSWLPWPAALRTWSTLRELEECKAKAQSLAAFSALLQAQQQVVAQELLARSEGAAQLTPPLQQPQPACPASKASQTSSALALQILCAMQQRNGRALLFLLHSAASHSLTEMSAAEHALLSDSMVSGLSFASAHYQSLGIQPASIQEYMSDLRLFVGRTALCLVGTGVLATTHLGVLRALLLQDLLPRVICGLGGGAMFATIACVFKDEELRELLLMPAAMLTLLQQEQAQEQQAQEQAQEQEQLVQQGRVQREQPAQASAPPPPPPPPPSLRLGPRPSGSPPRPLYCSLLQHWVTAFENSLTSPTTVLQFQESLRQLLGNETFSSVYKRTGRILLISVYAHFSGHNNGRPLILSYVSSPYVLLYSAIQASCTPPGQLAPSALMALDERGQSTPFYPPGVAAISGSL